MGAAEGGAVVVLIIVMAQASFGYSGWGDAGGVPGGAPIPTVAGYSGMDLMAPTGEVMKNRTLVNKGTMVPIKVSQALGKCSLGEKCDVKAMFRVPGPWEA